MMKDSRRPRILPLRPSAMAWPRASKEASVGCPETYDRPCAPSGL